MSKYTIKDYQQGMYKYDTIFVLKDKTIYQIPVKKGLLKGNEKEIDIEYFDRPIEE